MLDAIEQGWGCAGIELRQSSGGRPRLSGYAAVFNTRSLEIPPGFVEIIRAGAFTRTLRETDIRAFVEHDPARIIGRRSAGTLALEEDQHGLRVEITTIDTHEGDDVVKNIRAGNLDGMSFAFRPAATASAQKWDFQSQPAVRELFDVDVLEVSVVAMPAYPATSVVVRSMREFTRPRMEVARLEAELRQRPARWR